MPVSPDVDPLVIRKIIEIYSETELLLVESLQRRLARGIDGPNWYETKLGQTRAMRKQIERILASTTSRLGREVPIALGRAYATGVAGATADIGSLGLTIAAGFDAASPQAVRILSEEILGVFEATNFPILRQTEDAYRRAVSEGAPSLVTGARTRREASEAVLQNFARNGVKGFTDKAGRKWNLDTYAEMTMRTAGGRVQVEGAIQRFQSLGAEGDLVIVSDSPEECPLCRPWEGKILSLSGQSKQFPSLATATTAGLFHPNCTHSLGLYVPGLTKPPGKTDNPKGYEKRQEQRYLERQVRLWKRREAGTLTEAGKKRAAIRRRAWQTKLGNFTKQNNRKRLRYREQVTSYPSPTTKAQALTPTVPPLGPRGKVLSPDLLEKDAIVARTADARKDAVFQSARDTLGAASIRLDGALYDIRPEVRDLYAGVMGRVRKFGYRASSAQGRTNPITKLGETSIRATREAGGYKVQPNSLAMELEFRRSALVNDIYDWNRKAVAAQKQGGRQGLDEFISANPIPDASILADAGSTDLAETLVHELSHALDDLGGFAIRNKIERDGIYGQVRTIYASGTGDESFWYAATDPAETVAELARMYVFGTKGSSVSNPGSGLTAEGWRRKYPDLAEWVEKNMFGMEAP